MSRLTLYLAAAWWGSLTTMGAVVVPQLFMHLETPAMAGQMAGHLFTAQTWVSVVCCVGLLLAAQRDNRDALQTPSVWLIAGLLLALMLEVGVKPRIVARENLMLWHNLGSLFYVAQWGCAFRYLWQLWPSPVTSHATQATAQDAAHSNQP